MTNQETKVENPFTNKSMIGYKEEYSYEEMSGYCNQDNESINQQDYK